MVIEGKIIEKYDTVEISDSFKKREFILEYGENPQYPEYLKFELTQGNCEQLDSLEVDDVITVNFNLKGRKWVSPQDEVKYFNSLQAWRLDKKLAQTNSTAPPPTQEVTNEDNSSDDDLPF